MNEIKTAWYEKTGILVVLLIVFFPVGLYGVWKNTRLTKKTKGIITGVVAVLFIAAVAGGGGGKNKDANAEVYKYVDKSGVTHFTDDPGKAGASTGNATAPSASEDKPSGKPMWSHSEEEYEECARNYNSFDAAAGARLVSSPPLQADDQYYMNIGELERKEGKYYIAKRAGSQPPHYFAFKLHKKLSTPPFRINIPFFMVGRFVDIEDYRTVMGEKKIMPVFEAVCIRVY